MKKIPFGFIFLGMVAGALLVVVIIVGNKALADKE